MTLKEALNSLFLFYTLFDITRRSKKFMNEILIQHNNDELYFDLNNAFTFSPSFACMPFFPLHRKHGDTSQLCYDRRQYTSICLFVR